MSTGELVFYAGVALLAATVVLAVVFLIRRPVYRPEDAAAILDDGRTQPLRNAYPTDPLTLRQTAPEGVGPLPVAETEVLQEGAESTVPLGAGLGGATELLPEENSAPIQEDTMPLGEEAGGEATVPLAEAGGTVPLWAETAPLDEEGTASLVVREQR